MGRHRSWETWRFRRRGCNRKSRRLGRSLARRRQPSDRRACIRTRRQLRDESLHVPTTPAARPAENGFVVLGRQVIQEPSHRSEGERSAGQQVKDHREKTAGSSDVDPGTGRVLGEMQDVRAVAEERAVAFRCVQGRSRVQRRQMGEKLDRGLAFIRGEGRDAREEIVIGEFACESDEVRIHHAPVYHGDFRGSDAALTGARRALRAYLFAPERTGVRIAPRGVWTLERRRAHGPGARVDRERENAGPKQWAPENKDGRDSRGERQEVGARSAAIFCRKR